MNSLSIKIGLIALVLVMVAVGCSPVTSESGTKPTESPRETSIRLSGQEKDTLLGVIGNALMVANPEYYIEYDYPEYMEVDRAGVVKMSIAVRPWGYEGFGHQSWIRRYDLSLNRTGVPTNSLPPFPATPLTGYLQGESDLTTAVVDRVLAGLPHGVRAFALVELKTPLLPEQLREERAPTFTQVFFSPLSKGKRPIYWRMGPGCIGMYLPPCERDTDVVAQFENWVGLLKERDSPILTALGLDLGELRNAAASPRVYGYLVDGPPETVRAFATGPEIKRVNLIQVLAENR